MIPPRHPHRPPHGHHHHGPHRPPMYGPPHGHIAPPPPPFGFGYRRCPYCGFELTAMHIQCPRCLRLV